MKKNPKRYLQKKKPKRNDIKICLKKKKNTKKIDIKMCLKKIPKKSIKKLLQHCVKDIKRK